VRRPVLVDLFCKAGGAGTGYHRAGFDVVGVDIEPQPRYPFEFVQADAMMFDLTGFDAVHASPPCQDHSPLSHLNGKHGTAWMLGATLDRLSGSGLPYVVENVERADLPGSLVLCGSEFALKSGRYWLRRHRRFASNVFLLGAGGCHCSGRPVGGVYGTGGESRGHGYKWADDGRREAMGNRLDDPGRTVTGHTARLHRVHRRATDGPPGGDGMRRPLLVPAPPRSAMRYACAEEASAKRRDDV
jgi:DNA (cytosine-5)-methyltransferase 1